MWIPAASGLLLALAFPPTAWSWLAWVALVPWGAAMRIQRGSFELYLGAFIGGLVFQLAHLNWLRNVEVGQYGDEWALQGAALAVLWPIALCVGRNLTSAGRWPAAITLPIVWVAFEFSRRHLWALVDGTGYPWGQLGLTQAASTLLPQAADLGGVYAVTFVLAAASGALIDLSGRGWVGGCVFGALLLAALSYGEWRVSQSCGTPGPTVALMPDVVGEADADVLLWSEGALPFTQIRGQLREIARTTGATLVVGAARHEGTRSFNSAIFIAPDGILGHYDKLRLVPRSEAGHYTAGQEYPVFRVGPYRAAAVICYDICFPDAVRPFMCGNPDFFVVPAFEAHDSTMTVQRMMLASAKFRAIECRRTIVRNALGGYSGTITSSGAFATPINDIAAPMQLGCIPVDNRFSLYATLGDWLPDACLFLCFLPAVCQITKHYRSDNRRRQRSREPVKG